MVTRNGFLRVTEDFVIPMLDQSQEIDKTKSLGEVENGARQMR